MTFRARLLRMFRLSLDGLERVGPVGPVALVEDGGWRVGHGLKFRLQIGPMVCYIVNRPQGKRTQRGIPAQTIRSALNERTARPVAFCTFLRWNQAWCSAVGEGFVSMGRDGQPPGLGGNCCPRQGRPRQRRLRARDGEV